MSLDRYSDFFQAAEAAGWHIRIRDEAALCLKNPVQERYPRLPEEYLTFLSWVARCTNPDETAWFLCEEDYNGQSDSAFQWNEWELQSLEAAQGDDEWKNSIRAFWNTHFPIFLSVKSGYAYLAICVSETDYGAVVCGSEPEYEETQKIADSFQGLLPLLTQIHLHGRTFPALAGLF